ncbi:alpha-taxilin-like [Dendropsophus ebraccatus]|uniref:alpha-taxilin-like n=1 Tax=Dendropsophus ebraccatus TaxID=150705 RepID=UPI0038311E18
MEEMRQFIQSFSFDHCKSGNQGFDRILIQLFGLLGHGKSSFINTCIYVWEDGEFQNWSKSRGGDGGKTTERIPYQLTGNITLVDNRGCAKMDDHETGEIYAQLGNLLPLGKTVEWSKGFGLAERIVRAEKQVKTSDFIVPVFVHSVTKETRKEEKEELKIMFHTAQKLTGVFPIVVLTHKTSGALTETEGMFRDIGVDRIFSFENYTREDHMKIRGKHEGVLNFLCEVIKDAQFRVDQPRDPLKEMKERKQYVLNYNIESAKKEERMKEQKARLLEQALMDKKKQQQEEEMKKKRMIQQRQQMEELTKQQQELERARALERARQEEEARALAERLAKKKNRKILGIFKVKS